MDTTKKIYELFNLYLREKFSENTARNYYSAVNCICQNEGLTQHQLISKIDIYISKYKSEKYEKTHNQNKNALIQFKAFLEWLQHNLPVST